MHMLAEGLKKELEKYEKKIQTGDLSAAEWDCVFKAAKGYKDILTSMAMVGEDMDGEYSERSYSPRRYSNHGYSMMPMDYDDYSFAGGRNRNSMGRYSRSDEKEHLRRQIESLMTQLNEMN